MESLGLVPLYALLSQDSKNLFAAASHTSWWDLLENVSPDPHLQRVLYSAKTYSFKRLKWWTWDSDFKMVLDQDHCWKVP